MDHKPVSLADQVFERLEDDILTGKYQRGATLTENHLSEDMGVSRTPIREAIRRLEQERLIEISKKGIVILGITNEDIRDIYEIRLRIEGLAAASAAKSKNKENLAELKEALDLQEYYVTKEEPDRIKHMDSRFHELLYRLSGSAVLYDTLLPLHKKVQKFRQVSVENADRAVKSLSEHRRIFKFIAAHDADGAATAMTEHVKNAMKSILGEE